MITSQRAKEIIEKIRYITLATVTPDGEPWNSPVFSAHDEQYNFYWASWKENQHSKNICANGKVFLVIYDSQAPEGTGEGVYIQARAVELSDEKEIAHAAKHLWGRKNKAPRQPYELLGEYPRRMYKAIPEKIWMNSTGNINGNFIDTREEIMLN